MNQQELIEKLRTETKDISESYFKNIIDYFKWTTAFTLGAIFWVGNNLRELKGISQFLSIFSLYLLLLSFCASILIFFLILLHQNYFLRLKYRHRKSIQSDKYATREQSGERDKIITELSKHTEFHDVILINILLAVHFILLIVGLFLFTQSMIILASIPV